MDACNGLQTQPTSLNVQHIHDDVPITPINDASISNEQETDEIPLQDVSTKEILCAEVDLKQSLTLCPTSTPVNKNSNDRTYSNTPQTSPPRPTPVKSTLSETELASIAYTGSIMSSLSVDFMPECSSQSSLLASKDTTLPLNVTSLDNSSEIDIITVQTSKASPQRLLSPAKIPLHESCFQNGTSSSNNPNPNSTMPSLKRKHAETENDSSLTIMKSPKKARTTAGVGTCLNPLPDPVIADQSQKSFSTPDTGNWRYSKVSGPFRPPKSAKEDSVSGSATNQSSPRTPIASLPGRPTLSEPKKPSSHNSVINKLHPQIRHTLAVSKPFKSPFKSPLSSLSTVTNKSASSPNIRALEKKIVMLKRATKIVTGKEDEKLKGLIQKWKLAGREVAWELWSVMKDRSPEDALGWNDRGDSSNQTWNWTAKRNWGFDDQTKGYTDERHSGDRSIPSQFEAEMWNSINVQNTMKRQEAENTKASPHTLGTMLRSYNITDDILGWNDEEEDFNPLG